MENKSPLGGKTSLGTSVITNEENAQTKSLVNALKLAGNNPLEIRRALIANYPEPHRSKMLVTFATLKLPV